VFFEAKMRKAKTSVALSVSSDLDGAKIVQQIGVRTNKMIVEMLKSSSEPLTRDPELVGSILQGAIAGIIRRLLESVAPEREFESLREELILFARAYLEACPTRPSI
jgi:Tetracyclin repressor-like, C-terminal domain